MSDRDEFYRGDAPAQRPDTGAVPAGATAPAPYGPPPGWTLPGGPPPGYAGTGYAGPGYGPTGWPPPGYGPPGYGPAGHPPPGWAPPGGWRRPTNTLAILALVFAFVFAPAGLVMGVVARRQIRQTGEDGDGLALAAIVIGAVAVAVYALLIGIWLTALASLAGTY